MPILSLVEGRISLIEGWHRLNLARECKQVAIMALAGNPTTL
jgi:hypothetical protein